MDSATKFFENADVTATEYIASSGYLRMLCKKKFSKTLRVERIKKRKKASFLDENGDMWMEPFKTCSYENLKRLLRSRYQWLLWNLRHHWSRFLLLPIVGKVTTWWRNRLWWSACNLMSLPAPLLPVHCGRTPDNNPFYHTYNQNQETMNRSSEVYYVICLSDDIVAWDVDRDVSNCLLLVFIIQWGRHVTHHHLYYGGRLWLVDFDPSSNQSILSSDD